MLYEIVRVSSVITNLLLTLLFHQNGKGNRGVTQPFFRYDTRHRVTRELGATHVT